MTEQVDLSSALVQLAAYPSVVVCASGLWCVCVWGGGGESDGEGRKMIIVFWWLPTVSDCLFVGWLAGVYRVVLLFCGGGGEMGLEGILCLWEVCVCVCVCAHAHARTPAHMRAHAHSVCACVCACVCVCVCGVCVFELVFYFFSKACIVYVLTFAALLRDSIMISRNACVLNICYVNVHLDQVCIQLFIHLIWVDMCITIHLLARKNGLPSNPQRF